MALFDIQEPTAFNQNEIYKPANLDAIYGQNTKTTAGLEKTGLGIVSAVGGPWGALAAAGTQGSRALTATNNPAGEFFGNVLAPHTNAFNFWDLAGRKGQTSSQKARNVGLGFASLDPITGGIISIFQNRKRRAAQAQEAQLQATEDNPFDYAVDKDGLHYSPQNAFRFQELASAGGAQNVGLNLSSNALSAAIESLMKRAGQKQDTPQFGNSINMTDNMTSGDAFFEFGNQDGTSSILPNVGTDSSLNTAPPIGDGQVIETTPSGSNMNWGFESGGTLVIGDNGVKLRKYNKGGKGSVMLEGGEGGDDLAVVDTNTGKDTGVRMEKGEMVVFSKQTLSALGKALKTGDKDSVFGIVQEQVNKSGDNGGFAKGGVVVIDDKGNEVILEEDLPAPRTYQELRARYDYIQNLLGKGGFGSLFKGKNFNLKSGNKEDYDQVLASLEAEYNKLAPVVQNVYKTEGDTNNFDKIAPQYEEHGLKYQNTLPEVTITGQDTVTDEIPTVTEEQLGGVGAGGEGVTDPTPEVEQLTVTPESVTEIQATPENAAKTQFDATIQPEVQVDEVNAQRTPYDWRSTANDLFGYGLDAYRFIEGMAGANTKVPIFQKPAEWNDLIGRLHMNSLMGLTPEEKALYQTQADRQYNADVSNIYNLSGGNAGQALSNLGRANMNRYMSGAQLAAQDRNAMNQNLNTYGNFLTQDVNLDRMIFQDKLNQTMMTKRAGAQLASDALQNAMERNLTNQYYGRGSQSQRLMDLQLEDQAYLTNANKNLSKYLNSNGIFDLYKVS